MNLPKFVIELSIVIAVFFVMLTIWPTGSDDTTDRGWTYDDYLPAEDVISASGSLETITLKGEQYVHAKDIGSGTIMYSDGHSEDVYVRKAILDVVFMYGQSNAAYRYPDPSSADPVPRYGYAYYWGGSTQDRDGNTVDAVYAGLKEHVMLDPTQCSIFSAYDENGDLRVGDKFPSFCATYSRITGHKVLWVDGAVGGEKIENFLPESGTIWVYGKSMLDAAIQSIDSSKFDWSVSYYMWIQGESNSTTSQVVYVSYFLQMHDAMVSGGMGYPFKACIVSTVAYGNSIPALQYVSEKISSVIISTTIASEFTQSAGTLGPDGLHYSQKGDNIIGKSLGETMGHMVSPPSDDRYMGMISMIPLLILLGIFLCVVTYVLKRQ